MREQGAWVDRVRGMGYGSRRYGMREKERWVEEANEIG